MGSPVLFLLLSLAFSFPLSSSAVIISKGTSLSVEKPDILTSPNGDFSAGFYSVGDNAYCFAIWFSNSRTVVWMANRDQPVNGKRSKLSLLNTGNLILTDATESNVTVWATNTVSLSSVQLFLNNTGNLVLRNKEHVLWQSFDFPTDTLLPEQLFTRKTKLVSSRSQTNISSGFYELSFDNNSYLQFVYNGPDVSRTYYYYYSFLGYYNNSTLVFNSLGNFSTSDDLIMSADYGALLPRRLTLDYDGNIRLYSWEEEGQAWVVSWQAIQTPCLIPGACGANSLCSYVIGSGRKCSCPPGYKMKNRSDWTYGCEPEADLSCDESESGFVLLSHVDFYGYDFIFFDNYTFDRCRDQCLAACDCKAFQYNSNDCYLKTRLLNGYRSPDLYGDIYLKLPKSKILSDGNPLQEFSLICSSDSTLQIGKNRTVKFMLRFASGVGALEIISFFVVWCLFVRTQKSLGVDKQGHDHAAIGFRKFTYTELKKATKSFTEEIGRGAGGIGPSRSVHAINDGGEAEHKMLVTWVREKMKKAAANTSSLEEIIDPMLEGKYDMVKMKALVQVSLQCVEEDKDARPTMSQVVEMLIRQEKDSVACPT
ncbi:hypothetical protein CMV_007641 [Castanea mollissima]|uniref:Uncharacterized protein n=1 Tax=Castanea mollissima TaxID=60419 RepID=A0A8J4VQ21_9ROSI|nr:hypothetical protein CMV_007641 [Castanea mollissima]